MPNCDVAIVGAGPYGLSAAAHLIAANGLDIRVFGEAMSFWERHMPKGMLLRSPIAGTHISDPEDALTLQAYQAASGNHVTAPLPLSRFTHYGHWFQGQAVPHIDRRKIARLEKPGADFHLTTEDGETWKARRVVVAAGIMPFAWRPLQFQGLPNSLASHTSEHNDLAPFAGKKVIVVGGGQSALESAAMLHEMGTEVEVLVRARLSAGSGADPGRTPFRRSPACCTHRRTSVKPASVSLWPGHTGSADCLAGFRILSASAPCGLQARPG
jgi:cation diffusion facilitator CzcD-associated flavoprotein CzcO